MDVNTTIKEYRHLLHSIGYAGSTIDAYRKNLGEFNTFLVSCNINDLRQVNKEVIANYKVFVMEQKNSIETKALKLRPVKRLFEYLLQENRLLVNPTEGLVETCRKNRKIPPVLTVDEVKLLLQQPDLSFRMQLRNRAIMEVLYSTAIRLDELLNLTIYDPDFKEKTLFISKGKGRKQRLVPIGKNSIIYLRKYLENIRPRYAARNPKERTLFLTSKGGPLNPPTIRLAIREYGISAGITKNVSPHTFRRTAATHLLQQGADIRYIQQLLGHSRLSTTQLYTKIVPTDIKAAHEKYHPGVT